MKLSPCGLAVVLVAVLSSTAWARIGETIAECTARYGEPFKEDAELPGWPDSTTLYFKKSGLLIGVTFWKGKGAALSVCKLTASGSMEQLSDVEVETLLVANAAGKWTKMSPLQAGFGNEGWISEDGKALARQAKVTTSPMLNILTKEFLDADRAATAAQQKKNLEGF